MEISRTSGAGRRIFLGKQTVEKPGAQTSGKTAPKDSLTVSREALAYLEEQSKAAEEERKAQDALSESGGDGGMLDAINESFKTMKKCQEIARRIMRGDKVPHQDEAYLSKNDPKGYQLAMAMRTVKPDPKKCKTVLEDEDLKEAQAESTGESAAAPAEAPMPEQAAPPESSGAESGSAEP